MNQAIADTLGDALAKGEDAYAQALAKYWSEDGVDLCHEPALPQDGVVKREAMLQSRAFQGAAFKAAMPDFHHADIVARAVGDVVYLLSQQTGTMADGTKVVSPLASRFAIKDGKITAVALGIDMASIAQLRGALAAAAGPAAGGEARNF